jgi:hypothetical protein
LGVWLQVMASFSNLIGRELCEAVDAGELAK